MSFVTICVFEFSIQFEFLSFVTVYVFEFCHCLSFKVLPQFDFLSFVTIKKIKNKAIFLSLLLLLSLLSLLSQLSQLSLVSHRWIPMGKNRKSSTFFSIPGVTKLTLMLFIVGNNWANLLVLLKLCYCALAQPMGEK